MKGLVSLWTVACLALVANARKISQQTTETTKYSGSRTGDESARIDRRCSFAGQEYRPGDSFRPNPCSSCVCQSTGAVDCRASTQCDEIRCDEHETLDLAEGECCPRCKKVMCYRKGGWRRAGENWTENIIDNGKKCRSKCTCTTEGVVECKKSRCEPSKPSSVDPVCLDGGKVYSIGQRWTTRRRVNGKQCKMPCECTRMGKNCNKKECPKKGVSECRENGITYTHGEKYTKIVENACRKTCECVNGKITCLRPVCPTARPPPDASSGEESESRLPRCRLQCNYIEYVYSGCKSSHRQKLCTCPSACVTKRGAVRCCEPETDTREKIVFSCRDGRQKALTVVQATRCNCKPCTPSLRPDASSSKDDDEREYN